MQQRCCWCDYTLVITREQGASASVAFQPVLNRDPKQHFFRQVHKFLITPLLSLTLAYYLAPHSSLKGRMFSSLAELLGVIFHCILENAMKVCQNS